MQVAEKTESLQIVESLSHEYMNLMGSLKTNIKMARRNEQLTQEAASSMADIDYKRWQKIEAGGMNITLLTLSRIAATLRVPPSTLLRRMTIEQNWRAPQSNAARKLLNRLQNEKIPVDTD